MKICRTVNDVQMEFELTNQELYLAFEEYEHRSDVEFVECEIAQREIEEFESLTDDQLNDAIRNIAYEKRRQQVKYNYDESAALDIAIRWYIHTVLPDIERGS